MQLIQVYVQKSIRTTLPCCSSIVKDSELIHRPVSTNSGALSSLPVSGASSAGCSGICGLGSTRAVTGWSSPAGSGVGSEASIDESSVAVGSGSAVGSGAATVGVGEGSSEPTPQAAAATDTKMTAASTSRSG